jgi:ubiquinone/menaquinone biosynthesis C-methylase UbiE
LRYNAEFYASHYRRAGLGLRYDLLYRKHRIARMLAQAGVEMARPGFRAFEYGFGAGHLLRVVAGARAVVGMEASPSAVARACAMKPQGHPEWTMTRWSDAARIPLPGGTFDLVTASHVLEHLPDDTMALAEWIRLLRPGGHLLVILPSHESLFPGSKHLRVYEKGAFCERLTTMGLSRVAVDEHQRFDRPFKHRSLVLLSRKGLLPRLLVELPKTLLFLPAQLLSWRTLMALDGALAALGAKSSSVAYLFRNQGLSAANPRPA